jgi:farnesyl-diphosphate farnesyltransferase
MMIAERQSVSLDDLLRDHARTFALTLRLLPRTMREPLSITYLLARASDAIADADGMPREERLTVMENLQQKLNEGKAEEWRAVFTPGILSDAEEKLIAAVPPLMTKLGELPESGPMLRLWRTILEGQIFDLRRFPSADPLSREELERYCWLVAGSVGEDWTELIRRHAPTMIISPFASLEMRKQGGAYGMGLQLVNILRDRAADRVSGRIYAQDEEILELMDLADSWLHQGEIYLSRLKPGRIRYASEIPLRLALPTLHRIRESPESSGVKIARREVYQILLRTLPSLVLPGRSNPAS